MTNPTPIKPGNIEDAKCCARCISNVGHAGMEHCERPNCQCHDITLTDIDYSCYKCGRTSRVAKIGDLCPFCDKKEITGAVTITNTGVTSILAGSGISISGATGAVTVNKNPFQVRPRQVLLRQVRLRKEFIASKLSEARAAALDEAIALGETMKEKIPPSERSRDPLAVFIAEEAVNDYQLLCV